MTAPRRRCSKCGTSIAKLPARRKRCLACSPPRPAKPAADSAPGGELRQAFDRSAAASKQVVDQLDDALLAAGRTIADRVDQATTSGEGQEVTKALYLVPHMLNVLREMYATPKARHDAGLEEVESVGGKLAKLQSLRGGKSA